MKNLRIVYRLSLGFGVITIILLLLAATAWREISAIHKALGNVKAESEKMVGIMRVGKTLDNISLEMWRLVTAKSTAQKQTSKAAIEDLQSFNRRTVIVTGSFQC